MEEEPRILLKNAGNTCLNYKGENIGKLGALNQKKITYGDSLNMNR